MGGSKARCSIRGSCRTERWLARECHRRDRSGAFLSPCVPPYSSTKKARIARAPSSALVVVDEQQNQDQRMEDQIPCRQQTIFWLFHGSSFLGFCCGGYSSLGVFVQVSFLLCIYSASRFALCSLKTDCKARKATAALLQRLQSTWPNAALSLGTTALQLCKAGLQKARSALQNALQSLFFQFISRPRSCGPPSARSRRSSCRVPSKSACHPSSAWHRRIPRQAAS